MLTTTKSNLFYPRSGKQLKTRKESKSRAHLKSNLPAMNPLLAKSVTCTSSSGSEGRNPSAPRLTESSPSSCAPEGGASGELVQQRRAGGQVEELDVRQEASQCGHEHHALVRAGDA